MKKIIALCILGTTLSAYIHAQDTMRYGEPWYKFNTMPALQDFSFWEKTANQLLLGNDLSLQEYYNDYEKQLIYGIAYSGSGFYREYQINKDAMWKAFLYWGPIDSLKRTRQIDSLSAFARIDSSLIKFCKYEYEFALPTPHSKVVDCVEVYFDYPVLMQKDTFYAGYLSSNESINEFRYEGAKDTSTSVRWIVTDYYGNAVVFAPPHWSIGYDTWGVCFPIVKLRCTRPRGLQVAQNEAGDYVAQWPADSNAEDYEVAVCYTTQQPANDAVRYIPANGLSTALGHLSPDTTYRIHLRKRCSYTTSGYSDTVASDWSAPVIVAASSGINAASDRRLHFGIQPNPASGSATVELDGDTEGTLTLTDLFGRTLTTMAVHAGTTTAAFDLSSLPAGIYLLQLTTKDAMATRRLSVR